MPSVFTRIITGELPGRLVYQDPLVVAMLTIAPLRPGHTLVVPREEIDSWLDLPPELSQRVFAVAAHVGRGLQQAFQPRRVAALVLGLEVPHVHVHLVPIESEADVDLRRADHSASAQDLDDAAQRARIAVEALGDLA